MQVENLARFEPWPVPRENHKIEFMQIKHVKNRKKNLAFSVYVFISIEIDLVLAKLLT